ncbi:ADP-ribose pyrophosphatase YjhB (NUDIX family) [Prauserella isguenensis]|uniref:ADP-ribose pyrophosphatase YjhB (NUDIX family) n=1 Tax=Prauserella isguenensis TaxID=1470180 RepID=A0A839RZB5_9PSEU|nr:NUDIX domain-containing protein [Prauserella isguenensis]MBB3050605.1 ADP-ribose pyrophosphatase YjhB (NUDIX family) [Prauserella isguenensis]
MASGNGTVGVGVVVCDARERVLLGLRDKADEPTVWCLPGGAVDPGESFERAAARELAEETGLAAGSVDVAHLVLAPEPGVTATAVAVARDVRGEPQVLEPQVFRTWEWFADDDLPDALFPATRLALDALATGTAPDAAASYRLERA